MEMALAWGGLTVGWALAPLAAFSALAPSGRAVPMLSPTQAQDAEQRMQRRRGSRATSSLDFGEA